MNADEPTITVLYSCEPCGVKRRELAVQERDSAEDVAAWLKATAGAVARHHRERFPFCQADALSELMIPTSGRRMIGGPVEH